MTSTTCRVNEPFRQQDDPGLALPSRSLHATAGVARHRAAAAHKLLALEQTVRDELLRANSHRTLGHGERMWTCQGKRSAGSRSGRPEGHLMMVLTGGAVHGGTAWSVGHVCTPNGAFGSPGDHLLGARGEESGATHGGLPSRVARCCVCLVLMHPIVQALSDLPQSCGALS